MSRRQIEDELQARFPSLTRSRANKIARRNHTLNLAIAEAAEMTGKYHVPDPTGNKAVGNVMAELRGGAA